MELMMPVASESVNLSYDRFLILKQSVKNPQTFARFIEVIQLLDRISELNESIIKMEELSKRPQHSDPITIENKDRRGALNMSTGYLDAEKVAENKAIDDAIHQLPALSLECATLNQELREKAATLVFECEGAARFAPIHEAVTEFLIEVNKRKAHTRFRPEDLTLIRDRVLNAIRSTQKS